MTEKNYKKQECIPVGCVPSAAVAICWGVCLPMGGSLPGGVCPRGVCPERGVSVQGDVRPGGVCPWGVCPGGCLPKGVSFQRGECLRTEWHMPVKTLPWRNYVADGKNTLLSPSANRPHMLTLTLSMGLPSFNTSVNAARHSAWKGPSFEIIF